MPEVAQLAAAHRVASANDHSCPRLAESTVACPSRTEGAGAPPLRGAPIADVITEPIASNGAGTA